MTHRYRLISIAGTFLAFLLFALPSIALDSGTSPQQAALNPFGDPWALAQSNPSMGLVAGGGCYRKPATGMDYTFSDEELAFQRAFAAPFVIEGCAVLVENNPSIAQPPPGGNTAGLKARVAEFKAANGSQRYIGYYDFGALNGTAIGQLHVLRQHPDWFVYRKGLATNDLNNRLLNAQGVVILDVTNPDYQDYIAAKIAEGVAFYGMDGLYADSIHRVPALAGTDASLLPDAIAAGWASGEVEILRKIKQRIGSGRYLFANIGRREEDGFRRDVLAIVDGVMLEDGLAPVSGLLDPASGRLADTLHLYDLAGEANKLVVVTANTFVDGSTFETTSAEIEHAYARYYLATHLIFRRDNVLLLYNPPSAKQQQYGAEAFFSDWNVNVGAAAASYEQLSPGVFRRLYANATVYLNNSQGNFEVVATDGHDRLPNGEQVEVLSIPPKSGAILSTPEALSGVPGTGAPPLDEPSLSVDWPDADIVIRQINQQPPITFTLTSRDGAPVDYEFKGPTWLAANFPRGTVGAQPVTVTVRPNAGVQALPLGSYVAEVLFTDKTNTRSVARYVHLDKVATLTVTVDPAEGGGVRGSDTIAGGFAGGIHTLTALPNLGYELAGWYEGQTLLSQSTDYDVDLSAGSRSFIAQFQLKHYPIDVRAEPAAGGTVTGAGNYVHGAQVIVASAANAGYVFRRWNDAFSGEVLSGDPAFAFSALGPRELVAEFLKIHSVTAEPIPAEAGTLSGAGEYLGGEAVHLHAEPELGWMFSGWSENGVVVSTNDDLLFDAIADRHLVAQFLGVTTVAIAAAPEQLSVSGQSVTFTATVSTVAAGSGTPSGTVTFKDGSTTLGISPLSGGSATLATSTLSVAGHTITVEYSGDANFTTSTSSGLTQTVNPSATITALESSASTSAFGQSVTFTATVSADAPGSGTPAGTVAFKDGTTALGTGTLSGGTGTWVTSALAVAGHTITAEYGGEDNFTTSTSTGLTQTVIQSETSTVLGSSAVSTVFGQPVTFTATIAATSPGSGTPTGTVTFSDDGGALGDPVALDGSGIAVFSTAALLAGSHPITAVYSGDTNFTTSNSAEQIQAVEQSAASTVLSSSLNSTVYGQSVTFTATVAAISPGSGTPTGIVTFRDGGVALGDPVALDASGVAALSTSALNFGDHTITAVYDGDNNFTTSSLAEQTQKVAQSWTSIVLSSLSSTVFGQSVTFTASVKATSPGSGTPTGTVTFRDGDLALGGPVALDGSGIAVFSTSALSVGSHTVTAVYDGDPNYRTSTSTEKIQTVGIAFTATALQSSPRQSVSGQSVTLTARVTAAAPATGAPTGSVTFTDGSASLGGAVALDGNGAATLSTSALGFGNHTIAAVYAGNGSFAGSTSPGITQSVGKGATTTALAALPSSTLPGRPVSLTATVAAHAPATGTLTGTVTFKDGAKVLGARSLAGGKATLSTSALTIGAHLITANYGGSTGFTSSVGSKTVTMQPKVGVEFRVNTETLRAQQQPSIAKLSTKGFVAVWESNLQDGSALGVYAQRYSPTGATAGSEFRVNTTTAGVQSQPSVAALAGGAFVVVWTAAGQDGSGTGIYGQRFDAAGAKTGSIEFRVNTTTAGVQSSPSVAGLKDGSFVVAWSSAGQDGSGLGIYAQRFTASGAKSGAEFLVNTTVPGDQSDAAVAALTGGGFVVMWASDRGNGARLRIYGRCFSCASVSVGNEFWVNTTDAGAQSPPSVAALDNGGFVVAWESGDPAGSKIFGQRYSAVGTRTGATVKLNTTPATEQTRPSISGFMNGGGFFATWTSTAQDGSGRGVYGQAYDAAGARLDVEFPLNTATANDQWQPSLATLANRTFVAAWASKNQDGSREGVYAQRFNLNK